MLRWLSLDQQSEEQKKDLQDGFSLVEIVVALSIVALVASILIPGYFKFQAMGNERAARGTVDALKLAITQFQMEVGSYPQTLRDLERKPTDERLSKKWRGPYIESALPEQDPWENPYVYRVTPGMRYPYEIYSLGTKGTEGSKEDRIGQWNQ
jgi:general secretion pathway protein G